MDCRNSNKSIWTLVSGSVIQTNLGVLESELENCREVLSSGLLFYGPSSPQSAMQFKASKDVPDSWKDFLLRVGKTLGVEESICWDLVCSYLSTEFRGSQESLKDLVGDDQQRKPLLLDIWQFYRAERLYLLQVTKKILTSNQDLEVNTVMQRGMQILDSGQGLRNSLIRQLKAVTKERSPDTEFLGPRLAESCRVAWTHFNLRETSELLQVLLISLHLQGVEYADILTITEAFLDFGFGTKLNVKSELDDNSASLARSIGYLCTSTLVYMLDLPTLSTSVAEHKIWSKAENVSKMERLISGLGNHPSHSPALLAWTLGSYLARGADGLSKCARLGEGAIANRVLHTLQLILTADYNNHSLVSDIIHLQVYTVVSVLLSVFDPVNMGIQSDVEHLVNKLLKHRAVAAHFWKQGNDSGLALYFQETLQNFPHGFVSVIECLTSLASASAPSSQKTVAALSSLDVYTESVENINSRIGKSVDGNIQLLEDRFPYRCTKTICIPANTKGELTDNRSVRWRAHLNGWQILLAECGALHAEVSGGEEQVSSETLKRVTHLSSLISHVIASCPSMVSKLEDITRELLVICGRFCELSHPPLQLLATITQIFASIAKADPPNSQVMSRLRPTGLLPYLTFSHSLLEKSSSSLVPGVVGLLLAEDETVSGEYPLLLAFLSLLKESSGREDSEAGVLLVCREVLCSCSGWRYRVPGQRELILTLSLQILQQFINSAKEGAAIVSREQNVCGALLFLVSTGDRTIQSMLENQVSWEKGRGTDYCQIVHLALDILNSLLNSSASSTVLSGPVGVALHAPPSGHSPHLILSLAYYTYFFHDPALATAAVRLLASIVSAAAKANDSVSVLACLGSTAVSVKELLLYRLESPIEDIRLKIAIINLLSDCVHSQPGMIQLLLDININLEVTDGGSAVLDNTPAKLVGEGCLAPALDLLAQCRDKQGDNWQKLHLAVVKLIYNLWDTTSLLATRHLKEQPEFWVNLCWPISTPAPSTEPQHVKVKAYVLRVLANEIYTWKGKVSTELGKVLEKICDEKTKCLDSWCQTAANTTPKEKSVSEEYSEDPEDAEMFLISSWRIFLLVLSKDYPVSVSPASSRSTFLATVKKLIQTLAEETPSVALTVLLAETGTVLLKRWQTKCTDNMEALCSDISGILEVLDSSWFSLHPRARLSILALALSTLRVSQFKLVQHQELNTLGRWLNPVVKILAHSFRDVESSIGRGNCTADVLQVPELALSLLQTLIGRFTQDKTWLSELHSEATLQLLLSAAGACCRHKTAASFVRRILQLLVEVAASPAGSAALLVHELGQQLWLPLSDIPDRADWEDVFILGLELCSTLLRTGRTHALDTAITAVALLSDKLVQHLLKPRETLSGLGNAVHVARFIALLSHHVHPWRSQHQASLNIMYRCCCILLHYSTALLIRPTLLASMVKISRGEGTAEDAHRCRRVSTASCSDVEVEAVPPEAVPAHSQLIDISSSCLALLLSLSPGLAALLTGDALLDPERWQPLLAVSFSSPALEDRQEEVGYGTLLALANICVRAITRDHVRSPSPGRAISSVRSTKTTTDSTEKRGLTLVLERCLVLVLSQAILTLAQSSLSSRDKQILRRELGAELGSICDTWRRYFTRGGGKSPGPSRSARSPAPLASTPARGKSPPPATSPQSVAGRPTAAACDDQFIKFVSNLVGNVFK